MAVPSTISSQSNTMIDHFLRDYDREIVHYKLLENFAKRTCEEKLKGHPDVKAYISSRIKSYSSLKTKLANRHHDGEIFDSPNAIKEKIVDILGVRFSVYFPNSIPAVYSLIGEIFTIQDVKYHPEIFAETKASNEQQNTSYINRFPGYRAKHFRVTLKEQDKSSVEGYRDEVFEIQVVSAIGHIWNEVQHGIIYKIAKELDRQPSEEELRILDSLNGLVQTGEVILDQLKHIQDIREPSSDYFENEYELGSFLMKKVPPVLVKSGSISVLYKFLCALEKNTRTYLGPQISQFEFSCDEGNPLRERIDRQYRSFNLSASIYVIEQIISSKIDSATQESCVQKARRSCIEKAIQKARIQVKPGAREPPGLYKCTVVVSALIWLGELFSPNTDILQKILNHFISSRDRQESLKWVLESIMPTNILLLHEPCEEDLRMLDILWNTFDSSTDEIFRFVFKIAKIGVWRDLPEDIPLLEKMRSSLSSLSPSLLQYHSLR